MKTPHLATSILAATAMMASSESIGSPTPIKLDFRHNNQGFFPSLIRQSAARSGDLPGSYKRSNQNKVRKNRRRAFAAGNRKAFS